MTDGIGEKPKPKQEARVSKVKKEELANIKLATDTTNSGAQRASSMEMKQLTWRLWPENTCTKPRGGARENVGPALSEFLQLYN